MRLKDNEPVYLAEEISRKVSIFTLWCGWSAVAESSKWNRKTGEMCGLARQGVCREGGERWQL